MEEAIISRMKDIQYGCITPSVRRSTSSAQWRVCSTDLSHHQYLGGYTVRTCHIISTEEAVQYSRTASADTKKNT